MLDITITLIEIYVNYFGVQLYTLFESDLSLSFFPSNNLFIFLCIFCLFFGNNITNLDDNLCILFLNQNNCL